jgi:Holliday junction resolvasome RuvABC endonuclease subunit
MNFVGLDLSFRATGLTVLSDSSDILAQSLISSSPKECVEQRIVSIFDELVLIIEKFPPFIVCMEGLSFSSSGQATLDLAGLHFYIRIFLYSNYPGEFYVIPPTTLKKFVTGTGRCQKNLMLLKTYKRFGVEFTDDNLCDSYCLSRYGIDNYEKK